MAYNTFSPIVTDSMILCLDSVNRKSYTESETVFYDMSGYEHNFSMSTTPLFNGVMNFDGATDYGTLVYNSNFDLSSTDFTIEGYFKSNALNNEILISSDTYGLNFDWGLYILDSTTFRFYSNGTATRVDGSVSLQTGVWYHYVVTSISHNITIYCNGEIVGQDIMNVSNSSQAEITIGCSSWNNPVSFFNGSLSTIRIYRVGLSQDQIKTNYYSLKNRFI